MSVTVRWDDESCTILRVDFAGRWTLAEAGIAFDRMTRMLEGVIVAPPILLNYIGGYVPPHFGFDVSQSDSLPLAPCGLPQLLVFVGNPLVFELYNAARQPLAVQGQLHVVWTADLAAAREWVARVRTGETMPAPVGQPVFAN
jgi:hypothetical protein